MTRIYRSISSLTGQILIVLFLAFNAGAALPARSWTISAGSGTVTIDSNTTGVTFTDEEHAKTGMKVTATSTEPGYVDFSIEARGAKALLLPTFEGRYIPLHEQRWKHYLRTLEAMAVTERLSFPAWGYQCGDKSIVILLATPFDCTMTFGEQDEVCRLTVRHHFSSLVEKLQFELLVQIGSPSPLAPALQYRQWAQRQGTFRSLQEKLVATPSLARLAGAAHAYLWSEGPFSQADVLDWPRFCKALAAGATKHGLIGAQRLWPLLSASAQQEIGQVANHGRCYRYQRIAIIEKLNELFQVDGFWAPIDWQTRKRELASLPGVQPDERHWGGVVSPAFLEQLKDDGFASFLLLLGDLTAGWQQPAVARQATALGYLYGPYDSYHSIHHPTTTNSWPTAQFDAALFEDGAMVGPDGTHYRGFKGQGRKLNPEKAVPWVTRRVSSLLAHHPCSAWFIDCDAYGELQEDYSQTHQLSRAANAAHRVARLRRLADQWHLVVGSEGGAAYATPGYHFAHGMMTPVFGFADPDLKSKESRYWLGGHWPAHAPRVFIDRVPLKPRYRLPFYDPRYRLPLFQAAFHDSVVTTHWWGYGTLKFKGLAWQNELLELLYGIPPLYHLTKTSYRRDGKRMRHHYRAFSVLHRKLFHQRLTKFTCLDEQRLVQQTDFSGDIRLIANFSNNSFTCEDRKIPPRSLLAIGPQDFELRHQPMPD